MARLNTGFHPFLAAGTIAGRGQAVRSGGMRVLLVDSDTAAGDALTDELTRHGFEVTRVATAQDAIGLALFAELPFDALLTELALPDMTGRDLCRRLRESALQLPILVLSSCSDLQDIVGALDAGADDYLVKPYRIMSLLARLRAHARSHARNSFAAKRVGSLSFVADKRQVQGPAANRPVRLTVKEAELFQYLWEAKGKPVGRVQLMREVWGNDTDLESHAVEATIYRLRQKIEPDPSRPRFLLKSSAGYALVDAAVEAPGTRGKRAPAPLQDKVPAGHALAWPDATPGRQALPSRGFGADMGPVAGGAGHAFAAAIPRRKFH